MTEIPAPNSPIYSIKQAAAAIGRSVPLIKKWQAEGIPLIGGDDLTGSPGRGRSTRFTRSTVVLLAIMAEMTELGVPSRIAWDSAIKFTEGGSTPSSDDPFDLRGPGEPFKRGETVLVIRNRNEVAEFLHIQSTAPFIWPHEAATQIILINCGKVLERVLARLEEMEISVQ